MYFNKIKKGLDKFLLFLKADSTAAKQFIVYFEPFSCATHPHHEIKTVTILFYVKKRFFGELIRKFNTRKNRPYQICDTLSGKTGLMTVYIFFEDLSEVESVNRKGYRQREKPGAPEDSPEKQLPVLKPLLACYSKDYHRFKKSEKIIHI